MKNLAISLLFIASSFILKAQDITADEIVKNYIENTGGKKAWSKVNGLKMTAAINVQGMEIPLVIYMLKDGRTATIVTYQGITFSQDVYDGEVLWGMNPMAMKAEKAESEKLENYKRGIGEFPNDIFNYKNLGYTLEFVGEETKEGVECYKLKLTKKDQLVDGKETENVIYYFIDKENFVPIVVEQPIVSGELAGQTSVTVMSDYQEADGLYFAFSINQMVEGMGGSEIVISSVEINPDVDDSIFAFPGE